MLAKPRKVGYKATLGSTYGVMILYMAQLLSHQQ
jgi:hypothetical protein